MIKPLVVNNMKDYPEHMMPMNHNHIYIDSTTKFKGTEVPLWLYKLKLWVVNAIYQYIIACNKKIDHV